MPKNTTSDENVITIDMNRFVNARTRIIVALAVIIFVLAGILWWKQVYTSPKRTFEGMLKRNLTTTSVTKKISSGGEGQNLDQYVQLSFAGQEPVARALVVYEQKTKDGPNSSVKTETLGTQRADYSRYIKIETDQKNKDGKSLDFSGIENIWGKTESNSGETPVQNLQSAMFGLVPFARFDAALSEKYASELLTSKAYEVDYSQVKSTKVNGQPAWQYTVKVNVAKYLKVLQNISKLEGIQDTSALNPDAYKEQPPLEITVSVAKGSRQLLALDTGAAGQKEEYSAYGVTLPIEVPRQTVPQSELQQKLQSIR